MNIGIIGGTGWLGRSIATALLDSGFVAPESLMLSNRSGRLGELASSLMGVGVTSSSQELVACSDVVILSVRPEDLGTVTIDASGKLLISLVAGASLRDIERHTHCSRVVRAMPNAALELRTSYTPWLASANLTEADRAYVQRLFETCGEADEVFSESHLDYLTGLSGTGPSYPALLAQALFRDALARGLPEAVARRAVIGTVVHASQLISSQRDFDDLLATLLSYRGVSAAGIEGMRAAGFEASVSAGLSDAARVAASTLHQLD